MSAVQSLCTANTGWTLAKQLDTIGAMSRYVPYLFSRSSGPRWIAVWDLQWVVIESTRFEAGRNFQAALKSVIERWVADGWQPESQGAFGFVYIRRDADRRLLSITPKDPHDLRLQSFNPHRGP